MIAQRRSPGGHSFLQNISNGSGQPFSRFSRRSIDFGQIAGRLMGRKAGSAERLADVNVAQPDDKFLVEQRRFERRLAPPEQLREKLGVEGIGQGLNTESPQKMDES